MKEDYAKFLAQLKKMEEDQKKDRDEFLAHLKKMEEDQKKDREVVHRLDVDVAKIKGKLEGEDHIQNILSKIGGIGGKQ